MDVRLLSVTLLVGCGRLGFDSVELDAATPDPTVMFRSVGGNGPLASGAAGNLLEVVGDEVRFGRAPGDQIGVGDALAYDADGDGTAESLAFVHRRLSSITYLVLSSTNTRPNPTATRSSEWVLFRAYASLRDAAEGTPNPPSPVPWTDDKDLVARGWSLQFACYGGERDLSQPRFVDWVTSEDAYLRVFSPSLPTEVGTSQRHAGVWDDAKYVLQPPDGSNDRALFAIDVSLRVDGLQIFVDTDGLDGDLPYGIDVDQLAPSRSVHVSNSLIRGNNVVSAGAFPRGIKVGAAAPGVTLYAWNNVIYDFGGGAEARGVELVGDGTTAHLSNNTIANIAPAVYANSAADQVVMRNNVMIVCGGQCLGGFGEFTGTNNRGLRIDEAGVGEPLPSETITDFFVANGDFHLDPTAPSVAVLRDTGVDLSMDEFLPFDSDFEGTERKLTWAIGADQP